MKQSQQGSPSKTGWSRFHGVASGVAGVLCIGSLAYAEEKLPPPCKPENFSNPTQIDNPWMPLKPGEQLVWEGTAKDGDREVRLRLVSTVTSLTKVIGGIRTVVSYDVDYTEDQVVETELAFYAQDDAGVIWRIGEYPEEWEDDEVTDTPSWIHGIDGGLAGIFMEVDPRENTPSYAQGWGPNVGWDDRGQTYQMGVEKHTPYGDFKDVLVIDETSAQEPGAHQLKYYARGVGNIAVGWMGDDPSQEVLELVAINQLSSRELKRYEKKALEQEKRGYQLSPAVYALTEPIEGHDVSDVRGKGGAAKEPVRKITDEQARDIALKALPGKYMDIKVERKMGAKRLVVEIIAEKDGREWDVIIDMETGEVLQIAD